LVRDQNQGPAEVFEETLEFSVAIWQNNQVLDGRSDYFLGVLLNFPGPFGSKLVEKNRISALAVFRGRQRDPTETASAVFLSGKREPSGGCGKRATADIWNLKKLEADRSTNGNYSFGHILRFCLAQSPLAAENLPVRRANLSGGPLRPVRQGGVRFWVAGRRPQVAIPPRFSLVATEKTRNAR